MIRKTFCVLVGALFIGGCGIEGKMDETNRQMTETQGRIERTNTTLEQVHVDQKLFGALEI